MAEYNIFLFRQHRRSVSWWPISLSLFSFFAFSSSSSTRCWSFRRRCSSTSSRLNFAILHFGNRLSNKEKDIIFLRKPWIGGIRQLVSHPATSTRSWFLIQLSGKASLGLDDDFKCSRRVEDILYLIGSRFGRSLSLGDPSSLCNGPITIDVGGVNDIPSWYILTNCHDEDLSGWWRWSGLELQNRWKSFNNFDCQQNLTRVVWTVEGSSVYARLRPWKWVHSRTGGLHGSRCPTCRFANPSNIQVVKCVLSYTSSLTSNSPFSFLTSLGKHPTTTGQRVAPLTVIFS